MPKKIRKIAPRLANGKRRVPTYNALPDDILYGLRQIAKAEGKSVNWVKEQCIIQFFHMDEPEYLEKVKRIGRSIGKNVGSVRKRGGRANR